MNEIIYEMEDELKKARLRRMKIKSTSYRRKENENGYINGLEMGLYLIKKQGDKLR